MFGFRSVRGFQTGAVSAALVAAVALRAAAQCPCDCNGDRRVAVDELVTAVGIALARVPAVRCRPASPAARPTIADLVACVATAAGGCGTSVLFSADPLDPRNPFPTDRLRDATGRVRVAGARLITPLPAAPRYDTARALFDRLASELGALEGFSTWAPIRIPTDGAVHVPKSGDAPVALLVALDDPGTPVPIDLSALPAASAGEDLLELQPRRPLAPRTRYAYAVTRALRDADGQPVRPSPALAAALAGPPPTGLEDWRDALTGVLAAFDAAHGIAAGDIAVVDVFTTQPITDDLIAIRDRLASGALASPAPAFEDGTVPGVVTGTFLEGSDEFTRIVGAGSSDAIAAIVIGTFPSYDFRSGRQRPFDPARIAGTAVPSTNDIAFCATVPKAAPPAGGYPVAMFGPGLLNSGENTRIADVVGAEPMIGISIAGVEQGHRGDPLTVYNLQHAFASRDNLRQSAADFLQLAWMIRTATAPPFDRVDRNRIQYMGGSHGAFIGTLVLPLDPFVPVGMLSVPGSGLPWVLHESAVLRTLFFDRVVRDGLGLPPGDPHFAALERRLVETLQWAWDPADPINSAPYLIDPERRLPGVPPKRVLLHEGIGDTFVPNRRTDDLVRAAGLADLNATNGCLDPAGCSGVWRFDPVAYGVSPALAHFVTDVIPAASNQAGQFLLSGGTAIVGAPPRDSLVRPATP